MKTFAYIIFLCFIFSCGSIKKSVTVVGEYKSQRTNRVRVIVDYHLSGKIYVKDSMSVNQDATFIFKTCGNIINGNWKVSNDSLLLFVKSNRYRIDSLNYSKRYPKIDTLLPKKPMVFIIKKNRLRDNLFYNGKKAYYILEKQ